jgi:hypothetical protein
MVIIAHLRIKPFPLANGHGRYITGRALHPNGYLYLYLASVGAVTYI